MKREAPYFPSDGTVLADTLYSEKRVPVRPLGRLSDLAVEHLPGVLLNVKQGENPADFIDAVERHAANAFSVGLPKAGTDPYALGRLDLMLLYAGISHSGGKIGSKTSELVLYFSKTQPPTLTYEDIVLVNPLRTHNGQAARDPRTFTNGFIGSNEEQFYLIHQDLEGVIHPAVETVKDVALSADLNGNVTTEDIQQLGIANESLDILIDNTRTVGKSLREFDNFREYLNPITITGDGLKQYDQGPSGVYSGTVHALDLLVTGIDAPGQDEVGEYMRKHRRLFPASHHSVMDEAVHLATAGFSLFDLVDSSSSPSGLAEIVKKYGEKLLLFRHIHRGAVARQAPQALRSENETGTGGITNVAVFLENRIGRTRNMLQRLEQRIA